MQKCGKNLLDKKSQSFERFSTVKYRSIMIKNCDISILSGMKGLKRKEKNIKKYHLCMGIYEIVLKNQTKKSAIAMLFIQGN